MNLPLTKQEEPSDTMAKIQDTDLQNILNRMRNFVQIRPDKKPCPLLHPWEEVCVEGEHRKASHRVRLCPKEMKREIDRRIEREKKRIAPYLQNSGYQEGRLSVSQGLTDALDVNRFPDVQKLHCFIREYSKQTPPLQNAYLVGPVGTGKTSTQLALFFRHLEQGVDAHFIDNFFLAEIFRGLHSYQEVIHNQAEEKWNRLLKAQLIVWSDVGAYSSGHASLFRSYAEMLVETSSAMWLWSTNLRILELEAHPEIGTRLVSRLLASRQGEKTIGVRIEGPDQRAYTKNQKKERGTSDEKTV